MDKVKMITKTFPRFVVNGAMFLFLNSCFLLLNRNQVNDVEFFTILRGGLLQLKYREFQLQNNYVFNFFRALFRGLFRVFL